MPPQVSKDYLGLDQRHIWHPYASLPPKQPPLLVESTQGHRIQLADGRTLLDGMSSWWAAIHGYNHPALIQALTEQAQKMPHIMFGGLTHKPAIELGERLVQVAPAGLQSVFFADSGSVAMEVALKIAIQYWAALGQGHKHRFITPKGGYHGDTFGVMGVCDPENGMHTLFTGTLATQVFASRPHLGYDLVDNEDDIAHLKTQVKNHHHQCAAIVLEPIIQGAGGMRIYRPAYLQAARRLADDYGLLLIVDEIATGFGRTGKFWGCDHAGIRPDIMAIGKALTGGVMTLAATLTTQAISDTLAHKAPGVLMHGPTFMANPLACAVALASLDLLQNSPWQAQITTLEHQAWCYLAPLKTLTGVADVRILGSVAVVELARDGLAAAVQEAAVALGIWLRPFGRLVYAMPAYNLSPEDQSLLFSQMAQAIRQVLT